jgi:hypothetical protein
MIGTEITSGKLIIIDTTPPPTVQTLSLTNENNKIKVSWNYEGEDANHFNIYRSTTGNTDKTNLLTSTIGDSFFDSDIINKIGYFYRVSAVDNAGNEGSLSEESFLMTDMQNASSQFKQDPEILSIINQKISELESLLLDIDVRIAKLESITDKDLVILINQENLIGKLKESQSKIQLLVGELKTYRETKITSVELGTKMSVITTKLEEYKKELVKDVRLRNSVESEQIADKSLLLQAADAYLKNKPLADKQKQEYYKEIQTLQDNVRILQHIADYEVEYDYAEMKHITTITESILSPKELKGVVVDEIIPKDIVKISDISFITNPDDFNTLGVSWAIEKLEGAQVSYRILEEKDLSQLQRIRTVLLYVPDEFLSILAEQGAGNANNETTGSENSTNQITGGVINLAKLEFTSGIVLIPLGIVMIGLLVYYLFSMKPGNKGGKGLQKIDENIDGYKGDGIEGNKGDGNSMFNSHSTSIVNNNSMLNSQSMNDSNFLFSLIQKSYACLEQGNPAGAADGYNSALAFYAEANLSVKERMKVNLLMNTLRERLIEVLAS